MVSNSRGAGQPGSKPLGQIRLPEDGIDVEYQVQNALAAKKGRRITKVFYEANSDTMTATTCLSIFVFVMAFVITLPIWLSDDSDSSTGGSDGFKCKKGQRAEGQEGGVDFLHLLGVVGGIYAGVANVMAITPRWLDSRFTVVAYTAGVCSLAGGFLYILFS